MIDKQKDKQTETIKTGRNVDGYLEIEAERNKKSDRQAGKWLERQKDRQNDRLTERQTDSRL